VAPHVTTEKYLEGNGQFVQSDIGTRQQYAKEVHEALFALNTASSIVLFAFSASPETHVPFAHLEVLVNHLLGIRQTDFIAGHLAFWIPALILAASLWIALHAFSQTRFVNFVIKTLAGVFAFSLLPIVWVYVSSDRNRFFLWPYEGLLELATVIIVIVLVSDRKWSLAIWLGFSGTLLHYLFWYCLLNGFHTPNWERPGYYGPSGPIGALFASLAWLAYLRSISLDSELSRDA
jgi:hypothetical protein